MNLSPAIVSAITAAISVPLFMALMRRIKLLRHVPKSEKSFAELAREYARWDLIALAIAVVAVALITAVLWQLLEAIYRQQVAHLEPSRYLLTMPSIVWAIPAFFFAIFISALPSHYLLSSLLGARRYAEYIEYGNQKFQIDSWKLFRIMSNLLLPLCLALTFLALDNYARVSDRAFVVNRYFGIGETAYAFDRIESVVLVKSFIAPNGDPVRRPHYVIRFDDGAEFNFRNTLFETEIGYQRELAEFTAAAAGIEIVSADPLAQSRTPDRASSLSTAVPVPADWIRRGAHREA